MKLTCMVIIAVLFLAACQLIIADYSRDMQEHPADRSRIKMKNFRRPTLTKRCVSPGGVCQHKDECCSDRCEQSAIVSICKQR
uniref:Conotoxin Di6.1 n=1 Tax=Conus distans TaxID=72281 RepID=M9PQB4_CONDI|nr:conotoxin Di6.1 [Conus distans]